MASATISKVWRTGQLGPLPDAHLCDSLVPAFNYFALSDFELKRYTAVPAGIEFLPIGKGTYNNTLMKIYFYTIL